MKKLSCVMMLFTCLSATANINADDKPPGSINSFSIALDASEHMFSYTHFSVIGVCSWLHWGWFGPYITVTPEVKEYLPDLVVSVYNEEGDDPWFIARTTLDKAAHTAGSGLMKIATGNSLTDGRANATPGKQSNSSDITKSVDVVGSPMSLFHIPFLMLKSDTTPFMPYFQSALDSVPGRLGIAEDLRVSTWSPIGHYIGNGFTDHWAYEFPRDMTVDNNNDYKASVSIALHATDIVTNKHTLHVAKGTDDTCGTNCAVSNVIEEKNDDHEIWEELYPHDKHIQLGQSDLKSKTPVGQEDYKDGHGNYVFMVWRQYKGCIQSDGGHLIYKMVNVPQTEKR